MDWCGIVGDIRELFSTKWIVRYDWVVPKISKMPRREGAVYFSPPFKFMDVTWSMGIYWNSQEWIGLEIRRRSTQHALRHVCFSTGVMHADNLTRRNQDYPEKDNVCSIDQFIPLSILHEHKDIVTPWDVLTITCVIWSDVPPPNRIKRFHSEIRIKSENKECSSKKASSSDQKYRMGRSLPNIEINGAHSLDVFATEQPMMFNPNSSTAERPLDINRVPQAEVVSEPPKEVLNSNVSAKKKTASKSGTHFGILREFSKGVEWEVALPPASSKPTWNFTSLRFRCGELRCFFNLFPGTGEDVWLRFTILSKDTNFSPSIRWRLSVKSRDPQGLVGIMKGWRSGKLENNQYVQEISLRRENLESGLTSGAPITFVCHLSIGEVAMVTEDPIQQTEKILVSSETQTEDYPDMEPTKIQSSVNLKVSCETQTVDNPDGVEPTEMHSSVDLRESEEYDLRCLEIPKEEECIRHIQQSFERNLQELLSENPRSRRKHFLSAA